MSTRPKEKTTIKKEVLAPAKINLFLSVTGKREDGYHELTSVMAKLAIGDLLEIERDSKITGINLRCPGFTELENLDNLVYRAAKRWFEQTGELWGVKITLKKIIPSMAGLGGGSSDAVSALLGINQLADAPLSINQLVAISAEIGSDCPSFFESGLCVVEGRGERVRPVRSPRVKSLIGQEILLFKPSIGFSTAEVYKNLSRHSKFSSEAWKKERLEMWESGKLSTSDFLHNDLEFAVFFKHLYFRPLFDQIEKDFGIVPKMSGSGSACFALIPEGFDQVEPLREMIFAAWGDHSWLEFTKVVS